MSKIPILLVVYLRFYGRRYNGNYYKTAYNTYIVSLMRLLDVGWTRCTRNNRYICFTYDYDCTELNQDILALNNSSNEEVCRMILGIRKRIFAKSQEEADIINAMFIKMNYEVYFNHNLEFRPVGNIV